MKRLVPILNCLLPIMVVVCSFLLFEGSLGFYHLASMEKKVILVNLLTLSIIWIAFMFLTNRVWLAGLLHIATSSIVAAINYYVIEFKGNPLSFLEIKNFSAAMGVVSNYTFRITFTILCILAIFFAASAMCVVLAVLEKKYGNRPTRKQSIITKVVLAIAAFGIISICYLSPNAMVPQNLGNWRWMDTYYKYGYAVSSVDSLRTMFNYLYEPEGYSPEALEDISVTVSSRNESPDIILILNETFYDLSLITELNTDVPYLENYNTMENLYTGYAVVPNAAGGTNRSEYELLSSNSMHLLPGITPFPTLDLTNANSVVSHLNKLGYDTLGAHSESGAAYYRTRSYPALAFNHIFFDTEFPYKEKNNNRWYATDESLYKSLISWYENTMTSDPRFCYLLTIQNHGEWTTNDPEHDTVHAQTDYGAYDEIIDEYLSCIRLTDQAFKDLTEYYENSDRKVIICMMGDHSPNFSENVVTIPYSDEELDLQLRKTPLMIWANYDLDVDDYDLGTMSMNYIVPTLLDMAGTQLSPYYQYLLDLKEDLPILTGYGVYYDKDGNVYHYGDETQYSDMVNNYLYLEYNNLSDTRIQKYFDPAS